MLALFVTVAAVNASDKAIAGSTNDKLIILLTQQSWPANHPGDDIKRQRLLDQLVTETRVRKVVSNQPYCPGSEDERRGCESAAEVKLLIEVYAPATILEEISTSVLSTFADTPFAAYRVRERQPRAYQRDWPLGQPTPGARLVALMVKRDDMTIDEFDAYWRDKHTAIALAQPIGVWNYLQNIVTSCQGACEQIDAIALEQFRNPTAISDRFKKTPWSAIKGLWSARKFIDLSRNRSLLMQERVLKDHS